MSVHNGMHGFGENMIVLMKFIECRKGCFVEPKRENLREFVDTNRAN